MDAMVATAIWVSIGLLVYYFVRIRPRVQAKIDKAFAAMDARRAVLRLIPNAYHMAIGDPVVKHVVMDDLNMVGSGPTELDAWIDAADNMSDPLSVWK